MENPSNDKGEQCLYSRVRNRRRARSTLNIVKALEYLIYSPALDTCWHKK